MFAWLKLLDPKIWIALALAAVVAGTLGYTYKLGGDAPRTEVKRLKDLDSARLQAEAREHARLQRNVERQNEENTRRSTALERELARLRGGPVFTLPGAPAGSKCPEGAVCFDRAQFFGEYGKFRTEIREIAGQCSKVAIDLDTAIESENGN